jgi:hypothetical protein
VSRLNFRCLNLYHFSHSCIFCSIIRDVPYVDLFPGYIKAKQNAKDKLSRTRAQTAGAATQAAGANKRAATQAAEAAKQAAEAAKRAATQAAEEAAKKQLVGVQLPHQGGYVVTHLAMLKSLRELIAQLSTHEVKEFGYTFLRKTKQASQSIYGFQVFADYRAALKTQHRAEMYTVDENGNHLTKYCGECHTWLPIDLGAFDTPPCQVCAMQGALLADTNRVVSSPVNSGTEDDPTQPYDPSTTTPTAERRLKDKPKAGTGKKPASRRNKVGEVADPNKMKEDKRA